MLIASLVAQLVKNLPAKQQNWVWFLSRKDPLRRKWQPTLVFFLEESHEQRSLAGYSPWGLKSLTWLSKYTTTSSKDVDPFQVNPRNLAQYYSISELYFSYKINKCISFFMKYLSISNACLVFWQQFIFFKWIAVWSLSLVQLFVTPWTLAHQAPLFMAFPRQKYWSGLPFSPQGDLSNLEIKPEFPVMAGDSLLLSHREALKWIIQRQCFYYFFQFRKFSLNLTYSSSYHLFLLILFTAIKYSKTLSIFLKSFCLCFLSSTYPNSPPECFDQSHQTTWVLLIFHFHFVQ